MNKKSRVFDCFPFFNELDILDMRLNILNDQVDYFVLVESKRSHQKKPKQLYYEENKHLFDKFNKKIIHIVKPDEPDNFGEGVSHDVAVQEEIDHRNYIRHLPDYIELKETDVFLISDVDEIPKFTSDMLTESRLMLEHLHFVYNFNNIFTHPPSHVNWLGTVIVNYEDFISESRKWEENTKYKGYFRRGGDGVKYVKNAGWHFSYFGDAKHIKTKLENFCHPEVDTQSTHNIKEHIDSGTDFLGWFRGGKLGRVTDYNILPEYVLNNKEKYIKFF